MPGPWEELRDISDEQLYERYLAQIKQTGVDPGVAHYLDEMRHRQIVRLTERVARLTERVTQLTWAIAALTFVSVALIAIQLLE